MEIILVRHANCAKMADVLLGRTVDGPLDERGEGQARVVAKRLLAFPQLIVESSPRRRARHSRHHRRTARHDGTDRAADGRVDFGSWAGQSFRGAGSRPAVAALEQVPWVSRTPAGDTIRDVQARALAHFRKLEQTFDRRNDRDRHSRGSDPLRGVAGAAGANRRVRPHRDRSGVLDHADDRGAALRLESFNERAAAA